MESRKNLEVYRASAGSGKTFTLAVKYITLLIKSPEAYRHILAVTFTNKATGEMKERILSQLYGIAYGLPASEGYMKKMQEAYPTMSREEISRQARTALNLILHDYGHFRIQTIDAFFQSVLRSLAKELELNGDVEFLLNGEELLDEAVDVYIKRLEKESDEMEQIISYIDDKLDSNKSWKVAWAIKAFAKQLLQEEYQQRGDKLREEIDAENGALLKRFRAEIESLKKACCDAINNRVNDIYARFAAATTGMCEDDFFGRSTGVWKFFNLMNGFEFKDGKFIKSAVIDKIVNGTVDKGKLTTYPAINDLIVTLLQELKQIENGEYRLYNSCVLSLEMFHRLRLLNNIAKTLKEENERENRFLLAETTYFLSRMITDSTSFIFEKIGTEINHIFIDEFQDTSKLQWECFKILLDEVIARGNYNLIVGDVKQSIYRWRNSDWDIMNSIESYHPETIEIVSQDVTDGPYTYKSTNYRSTRRIVAFNNMLFSSAVKNISATFHNHLGAGLKSLQRAYGDVEQAVPEKRKEEGYVQIREIVKQNSRGNMGQEAVTPLMSTLHNFIEEQNIPAGDIAILVRGKSVIPMIVEAFKQEFPNRKIVSHEAYKLSASMAVQLIIAAMRHIYTPNDDVNLTTFVSLYNKLVQKAEDISDICIDKKEFPRFLPQEYLELMPTLIGLPIYELIEKLISVLNIDKIESEGAYLFTFLDKASECINNKASDIKGFLEAWENGLCDETIPAAGSDSVTIMTIHASKGLEFGTVIIPFCNWELTGKGGGTLWCDSEIEPFNTLSLIPVTNKKLMLESIYEKHYNHEYLFQIVDNLNLLYVATTRAKRNLVIFIEKGKGDGLSTLSKLVASTIPALTALNNSSYDADSGIYTYGEICLAEEEEKEITNNPFIVDSEEKQMQEFCSYGNRLTFKQSRELARFLVSDKKEKRVYESIARGELMHSILAKMATGNELPRQLNKLLLEGLISTEKEKNYIKSKLEKALQLPQAQDWFSGRYKLFNECAILCKDYKEEKNTYRPDRVMIDNDNVIVVDYKFAKKRKKHCEQVRDYMNLLAKIGYTSIKGYVWYVDRDEIIDAETEEF